jgi:hypothetical protein
VHDGVITVDLDFELSNRWVIKEKSSECLMVRHFDHAPPSTVAVDRLGLSSVRAMQS